MPTHTLKMALQIKIGGIIAEFLIPSCALRRALATRYKSFLTNNNSAQCRIVCVLKRSVLPDGRAALALTRNKDESWLAQRRDFYGCWNNTSGRLVLTPSLYTFDAFLRVFFSTLLIYNRSLLVHASGFARKRRSLLFCGPSGTGKTTIATLASKSSRIINDELCVVSQNSRGGWLLSATPFWGSMGVKPATRRRYPLAAVCFPIKSAYAKLRPAPSGTAFPRLLRCICLFGKNKHLVKQALSVAAECITAIPCYDFYFTKQSDVTAMTDCL